MKRFTVLIITFILLSSINAIAQWQPDIRLTNDPAESFISWNNARCIAVSGSVVHIVWFDNRDGNQEIYYNRSTDGGVIWGADTRLTNFVGNSSYPSITVSGSVVHIVWMDDRDGNTEIYYKRSSDAGVSWGTDTRLTNNSAYSDLPSVAVSGSIVHVVWTDTRDDNNGEIYYKRSTDAGVSWDADTRLTNNASWSQLSSVAVSGSLVHVVWVDNRDGNYEIYYKNSTDGGIIWGTDLRLTNNSAESWYPSVAVSGSTVHVVFDDYRDPLREIYYKKSPDGGVSWGVDTRLTNNPSDSRLPNVAVFGTVVYVAFNDNRDGNFEIYFKRDPTGNPIGIQNISTEIPSSFSLKQNYPNPFNPTTKIKFDVVRLSDVKIVVYDVTGREVSTLVNESLQPGTYETTFDASALSSGIYFYILTAGDFKETKRMSLLK